MIWPEFPPPTESPPPPSTHVVAATGRFVAVSGQLPLDEDGKLVGEGGARSAHIPDDRLPASSAVQVAALVGPRFLMEVEAFAVVGG